ncbi:hypothetical protein AB4072_08025 [Microvirga sp. 2MCAF38]|uniref:hypothetical protein n=1 Tax=Microvirga sp. 2MCAF38 TaxID=3232989 RepID=UPI003F9DC8BA
MVAVLFALLIGGIVAFAAAWTTFGLLPAIIAAPFGGSLFAGAAAIAIASRNRARHQSERLVAVESKTGRLAKSA